MGVWQPYTYLAITMSIDNCRWVTLGSVAIDCGDIDM